MRNTLLLCVALPLSACDRVAPGSDEPDPALALGTFEAVVRQVDGPAFEQLRGTATFAETDAGAFAVRLASPIGPPPDTTTLDLLAVPTTPDLSDDASALCYRSPIFADGPYRDEAGTLAVTRADGEVVEGTVDGTAFVELQTGPTTTLRLRVRVEGIFRARPAVPGTGVPDAAAVRRCLTD